MSWPENPAPSDNWAFRSSVRGWRSITVGGEQRLSMLLGRSVTTTASVFWFNPSIAPESHLRRSSAGRLI
jgi:hypothetical protein